MTWSYLLATCCYHSDDDDDSSSSREAEWRRDLEDEVWVMREEFGLELAGRQAVYQQELQVWKEQDKKRVMKGEREMEGEDGRGREEEGEEMEREESRDVTKEVNTACF